jgi:hypothetical protein
MLMSSQVKDRMNQGGGSCGNISLSVLERSLLHSVR